jgi:hypothetical protein
VQLESGLLVGGLARYCNDAGPKRNNVIFTQKPDTRKVCGIKVLQGKEICNGDEIFWGYGGVYWKTRKQTGRQERRT